MSQMLETRKETIFESVDQESILRMSPALGRTVFEAIATDTELEMDLDMKDLAKRSGGGTLTHQPGGSQAVDDRNH